jgi:pimeloyl-ACP methyl ester carboxylesterase
MTFPAGFRSGQFDNGDVRLNYISGPDNGPPLVLIPAQMGTWESYRRVLAPLSQRHHVYALDVRGHGGSTWTPGAYNWKVLTDDLATFLSGPVGGPAIVSGNSSGGLIGLSCAAREPDLVSGLILEDAPVFSAEMPRFRDRDRFVYRGLEHAVAALGDLDNRDLADYLRGQSLPVSETREKRIPDWFTSLLSARIRAFQAKHPGRPVDLRWWPATVRVLIKSLSTFDPDFARAFVDGRMYEGLDHADALSRVRCPLLVLHANWHRYPQHGLVGAMDDDDAARIRELAPQAQYQKIPANHVIHAFRPRQFVAAVERFTRTLRA